MRVFALTGAGLSAESGMGTFRDRDGIWARFDPMTLATPEAFARDPATVHAFYNDRRRSLATAVPNAAHAALARLEGGVDLFHCTQNIDDLLERAGARAVHHMHGELLKARCGRCAAVSPWPSDLSTLDPCPACGRTGALRPDVVWFGEIPYGMDAVEAAAAACDLFVAIGTSGEVHPAAGLVRLARDAGARTCEINLAPSAAARAFHDHRYGPATETVPRFVADLLP